MITVGKNRLSAEDFEKILYQRDQVALDASSVDKVKTNFDFLKAYAQNVFSSYPIANLIDDLIYWIKRP